MMLSTLAKVPPLLPWNPPKRPDTLDLSRELNVRSSPALPAPNNPTQLPLPVPVVDRVSFARKVRLSDESVQSEV